MTKPARQISPNEVVATLLCGQPGMDWDLEKVLPSGEHVSIPYRMQIIATDDSLGALKDAQTSAKDRGELEGYGDIYKESQAHELLVRAMRHREQRELPDGTKYYPPIFVETRQLRQALTELEMAALLNAYEITKSMFAVVEGLEAHDAESWIARLSDPLKGPFELARLDSLHWRPCILMLAQVARRLLEESGQSLPSLEPTSESDPDSSTSSTGSSGPPPSASSTGADPVQVPGDRLISKDEAAAILKQRKGEKE